MDSVRNATYAHSTGTSPVTWRGFWKGRAILRGINDSAGVRFGRRSDERFTFADCGKEKRGRIAWPGEKGTMVRQVSWDDWLAMADIWRMARTKRTECLWSQSLTGCVHYRWLRDWFVSLSKTRTHRRRPPPLLSRGPSMPESRSYLQSPQHSFRRFILVQRRNRTDHDDDPERTSIGADSPDWQCRERPSIQYQLIRFANLRPPGFRGLVVVSLATFVSGTCVDRY